MKMKYILLLVSLAGQIAGADTITVTSAADSGAGTLRHALAMAADGDTIDASHVAGTILLTSGELLVTKSVTIAGPGPASLALDGNAVYTPPDLFHGSRAFHISSNSVVSISGLSIVNGGATSGGGIYNDHATLTVSNVTFFNNSAGFGGAIYNNGEGGSASLTFANSSLLGFTNFNQASHDGGGIFNDGSEGGSAMLTVCNSTLAACVAYGNGGAIYNDGSEGGNATLTIVNSTLGSGIYNDSEGGSAIATIASSTLVEGDIANRLGILEVAGSIFMKSRGTTITNISGTVTSLGYNLSSDDGAGFLTAPGDQINTDPMLGQLRNNGGPTFTYAPLCGSPAIDRGKNFIGLTTDQRGTGFVRTFDESGLPNSMGGDGTDIGAVEVASKSFTVMNTDDSGPGSLRQAILDANYNPGFDTIEFTPGVRGSIVLTSGELFISDCLSINGPGVTNLAVNGNASSRVFGISSSGSVIIIGLIITNGIPTGPYTVPNGGGILNHYTTLVVSNCVVTGNSARSGGGGLFNNLGAVAIANSTISDNSSDGASGGGIYNHQGTMAIANSTVSGNSAASRGGGIHNNGSFGGNATLTIVNSTLSDNSTRYAGGGIWNDGSSSGNATLTILSSTLSGNSAQVGGGIFNGLWNSSGASNSTTRIGNTILKAGSSGENLYNYSEFDPGTVTSLGYNLSSDDGGGFLTNSTDQVHADPMLGPLEDNGGPTFTHAPLCGSPAIDQGKNFSSALSDQRGLGHDRTFDDPARPNAREGDGADIGAFEIQQGECASQDSDGDGVRDMLDQCPDTPPGTIVDSSGCSVAQLVPCAGPRSGGTWKNHGRYGRAVLQTATDFLRAGLITRREWGQIVTSAARSNCGWNRRSDPDRNPDRGRDANLGRGR